MSEPFLAMLILFGGNFAIRGWAMCWGQIVSIAQNQALFALLGTTFGGDGQTTFALPDLRGRTAVGTGQGPGLSNYSLGQIGGTENTTLLITNMPAHNHVGTLGSVAVTTPASTGAGTTNTPGPTMVPAVLPTIGSGPGATQIKGYKVQDSTTTLAPGTASGTVNIGIAGGSQPFSIQNPYLALTYLIALEGIFPSRN